MSEIRIPTQKRSIEKKDKIVEKGFELMCENGYFNTSTNDIAKNYSDTIMFPILDILKNNNLKFDNLDTLLDKLLDSFINKHTLSKKAHEEMMALSHLDEDIAQIFHDKEMVTTKKIVEVLEKNKIDSNNLIEKVHIIIGIVENYCHEIVYHKHTSLNYNFMKQEVINVITNILK